jgi:hypothetical protein
VSNDSDADVGSPREDFHEQLSSLFLRNLLGVAQPLYPAVFVQHDSGGNNGAGHRTSPCLIDTGDDPEPLFSVGLIMPVEIHLGPLFSSHFLFFNLGGLAFLAPQIVELRPSDTPPFEDFDPVD